MSRKIFTLEEIISATGGELLQKNKESFSGICTDTRKIVSGDLFIPLKGENFNGHHFLSEAFSRGAVATLVEEKEDVFFQPDKTYIQVKNSLIAYQNIASFRRKKINPFTIGITGSSGKTSTKELAHSFFSEYLQVLKSPANFNNEIGVPLTLLQLQEEDQACLIEMGMRGRGQISDLAVIARPNAGIITNAGSAHIELLGSREEIAKAKWELAEYLAENDGFLAIPAFDQYLSPLAKKFPVERLLRINLEKDENSLLYADKIWLDEKGQHFTFFDQTEDYSKERIVSLKVPGRHQVTNTLLVLALAKIMNISFPDQIVLDPENLSGRNETIKIGETLIINDSYNANPESMRAAIETFLSHSDWNEKIIVLGEMKELGNYSEDEHFALGLFCSEKFSGQLVVIGKGAEPIKFGFDKNSKEKAIFCENNLTAATWLANHVESKRQILLKGSRGAKMEEIIEIYRKMRA